MERAGKTRRPWRSWSAIAVVLMALALAQACSDSSNRTTGPTKTTAVGLKVHRAAQIPGGCTGILIVDGPNGYHIEAAIQANGEVSFPAPIGVPLTLTVVLNCGAQGTFTGSTGFTAGPGNNKAEVTVVATQAGASCSPSTVAPGQPSACVCTIKSPTPPTVTWTGSVSPTTGLSTTFSNSTPGTYTVTCTVNNATSASTTVTVQAPAPQPEPPAPPAPPAPPTTGTIEIFNDFNLQLRRRGLAEHSECSFCEIFTRVIGVPGTTRQIEKEHSTKVPVPPGTHSVEGSCNSGFDGTFEGNPPSVTVAAGQEVDVHFAGFCED